MTDLAVAIRTITRCFQEEIDEGERANAINAENLIEILITIADKIDPPATD